MAGHAGSDPYAADMEMGRPHGVAVDTDSANTYAETHDAGALSTFAGAKSHFSASKRARLAFTFRIIWSILCFVVVVIAIRVHARTDEANSISMAVTTALQTQSSLAQTPVASLPDAIQEFLSFASMTRYVVPVGDAISVGNHNFLLGGVRLSQSRYSKAPCPNAATYSKLSPRFKLSCLSEQMADSDFGIATDPAYANNSVMRAFQYRPSFAASLEGSTAQDKSILPFFIVLPQQPSIAVGADSLLNKYGWIDNATAESELYFILCNFDVPESPAWTEVILTFTFSLGGEIISNLQTSTIWTNVDNYGAIGVCYFIVMVVQTLDLVLQPTYFLYIACRYHRSSWRQRLARQMSSWHRLSAFIIDAWCAGLMIAGAAEANRQAELTRATEGVIANGKWTQESYESDTVNMQISMAKVSDANTSITWLAVNAVVLYALKVIMATSFASRLGNLHRAFIRAVPDLASAGLLVALVMSTFAVIGQILYGAALPDWANIYMSALSLFRELNGEGNTLGMIATNGRATTSFYIAYYCIVQSSLIVILFAIVGDSYSSVRDEMKEELARLAEAGGLTSPGSVHKRPTGGWREFFRGLRELPAVAVELPQQLIKKSRRPSVVPARAKGLDAAGKGAMSARRAAGLADTPGSVSKTLSSPGQSAAPSTCASVCCERFGACLSLWMCCWCHLCYATEDDDPPHPHQHSRRSSRSNMHAASVHFDGAVASAAAAGGLHGASSALDHKLLHGGSPPSLAAMASAGVPLESGGPGGPAPLSSLGFGSGSAPSVGRDRLHDGVAAQVSPHHGPPVFAIEMTAGRPGAAGVTAASALSAAADPSRTASIRSVRLGEAVAEGRGSSSNAAPISTSASTAASAPGLSVLARSARQDHHLHDDLPAHAVAAANGSPGSSAALLLPIRNRQAAAASGAALVGGPASLSSARRASAGVHMPGAPPDSSPSNTPSSEDSPPLKSSREAGSADADADADADATSSAVDDDDAAEASSEESNHDLAAQANAGGGRAERVTAGRPKHSGI